MPRLKVIVKVGMCLALVLGIAGAVPAGDEVTVSGKVMCAKCTLKKADATECQDVLVSKNDAGETSEYYIAKNEVAEAFGHVCQGEKAAVVTGTVAEKDGKTWITPKKMEEKTSS